MYQSEKYQQSLDCIGMIGQIQTKYTQIKQIQKNKRVKHNNIRRSYRYKQNEQYNDLNIQFDYAIQRSKLSFRDHRLNLQQQLYLLSDFFYNRSLGQQERFMQFVVRVLIKSDKLLQSWMDQQIVNLHQQMNNILDKNIGLGQQLNQFSYEYQLIKQNLQQQKNNRIQIQRTLTDTQKQLLFTKRRIKDLQREHNTLLFSKQQLQQQIFTKQAYEYNLKKTVNINNDSMKQLNQKAKILYEQNYQLKQKILLLQQQLEQVRLQQNNYVDQIKHLSEIIDNQQHMLDFYKNRENTSIIHQSYQKLNIVEDFDKLNASKISLSQFYLSHQKSMKKIHQLSRRQSFVQKVSQSQNSLNQFDYVVQSQQNLNLNLNYNIKNINSYNNSYNNSFNNSFNNNNFNNNSFNNNNFNNNNFNHITFRPQILQDGTYLKQYDIASQSKTIIYQMQQLKFTQNKFKSNKIDEQSMLSNKKYNINMNTIQNRRLNYKQNRKILQLDGHQSNDQTSNRKSQQSLHSKMSKVKSVNRGLGISIKQRVNFNLSEFNGQTNIKQQSTLDNKSEANSVNRLLIKRNIQKRRQVDVLNQQIINAQKQIRQHQQVIGQLQDQIYSYKQQLNRANQQRIRYKSEIYSSLALIQTIQIQKRQIQFINNTLNGQIQMLNQSISLLNYKNKQQIVNYQQRIKKVKQFCRQFLQKKHQSQIKQISQLYEQQINQLKITLMNLKQNIPHKQQKNLALCYKIMQQKFEVRTIKQNVQTQTFSTMQNEQININEQRKRQVNNQDRGKGLQIVSLVDIEFNNQFRAYRSPHFDKQHMNINSPLNINSLQTKDTLNSQSQQQSPQTDRQICQYLQTQKQELIQHQKQNKGQQQQQKQQQQQQKQQQQYQTVLTIFNTVQLYQDQIIINIENNDNFMSCLQDGSNVYIVQQMQNEQNIFEAVNNSNILNRFQSSQQFIKNKQQALIIINQVKKPDQYNLEQVVLMQTQQKVVQIEQIGIGQIQQYKQTCSELNICKAYYQTSLQQLNLIEDKKNKFTYRQKNTLIKLVQKYILGQKMNKQFTIKLGQFIKPEDICICHQKTYLIYVSSNLNLQVQSKIVIFNKKIIYDLCQKKKLQPYQLGYVSYIIEFNKLILGNCEVQVNSNVLLINRKNKKCFYKGNLLDHQYKILNWQQIHICHDQNNNNNVYNFNLNSK